MNDRHRWIVYPLLFLAIGLGIFNNLHISQLQETLHDNKVAEVDLLRCKAIDIVTADNKTTARLATNANGTGLIETYTSNGDLQSRLSSTSAGANLELLDAHDRFFALVGHDGKSVGLFVGNAQTGFRGPLTSVIVNAPEPKPAQDQPAAPDNSPAQDPKSAPEKDTSAKESGITPAPAQELNQPAGTPEKEKADK